MTTKKTLCQREALRAEYLDKIGYDPFADDPSATDNDVRQTLAEYDIAVSEAGQ